MFEPIVRSIGPERVTYFNGSGYNSFAKLVNTCVANSYTETVILMSDKVLPSQEHVKTTLELLDKGYGLVALYRFAFFGFKKELMRQIGMMDEGHIGGGYEDDDFYIRCIERDIAMYVTHDVPYAPGNSGWNYDRARQYHFNKWRFTQETMTLTRHLPEPELDYDLGPSVSTQFLSAVGYTYTPLQQVAQYFTLKIESAL
jgi:hypothetical protein